MIRGTKLGFEVLEMNNCKLLGILDTSVYNNMNPPSNATIQIVTPFDSTPVETDYYKNALTVFNSNTLKITNVNDTEYLTDLPDGIYTAKVSVCPEDQYWYEDTWFRTCLIECKFDKAFLKLNVQTCETCFSPEKIKTLTRVKVYIMGVKANVKNCNMKEAQKLYSAANKLLDKLLECSC